MPTPPSPFRDAAAWNLPPQVECPFCRSPDSTELHSPFGPQLSVATYWCHTCHSAFEYIKWQKPAPE